MKRVREEWVAPTLSSSRQGESGWLSRREARAGSRQRRGGGEGGERARSQDREGAAEEELKEREKRETRGREEGQGRDCDTRATRHEL